MAKKSKPTATVKAKKGKASSAVIDADGHINVGYFSDFSERVARSYGYDAAYRGQPRSANPYTGNKGRAWDEGYDAALS